MAKKQQGDSADVVARASQRILDVLAADPRKAMSIKDLSKALKTPEPIGTSDAQQERLARAAVKQLSADRKIHEHPKVKSALRYGASPPDPRNYFTRTGLKGVQTKYAQLLKAGAEPGDILAAIGEKLAPPYRAGARPRLTDEWLEQVVKQVQQFTQHRPSESYPLPQLYRDVAEPQGVSLGEFHDGLRRLSREARIRLIEWTQPLRTMPDERFALIAGGEIRYYARIS
jgi:hypothetical protein